MDMKKINELSNKIIGLAIVDLSKDYRIKNRTNY